MTTFDPLALRSEFPALARRQDGRPVVFLDGPGGTQVSQRVIDAVTSYYVESNANDGGAFATSAASDAIVAEAHAAVADLVGAASPDEIKFGYNMTTLTFHISRSIAATFRAGDEIIVTTLDHEANVSPWHAIAADRGLTVRTVEIRDEDCTIDLADLESRLSPRTRLVATGYASNAVGTINPVKRIVELAHAAGALAYVDAVHYVPHGPVDVRDLGTDFLVTSAYKWFGPHLGALYGRAEVLEALPAYKVRPAHDRFETGTQNFEAIAGTLAAVDYLRSVGTRFGDVPAGTAGTAGAVAGAVAGATGAGASESAGRRRELVAGMTAVAAYERGLSRRMLAGLAAIPGVRVWGIVDPARVAERTPTFALTFDATTPRAAAEALGRDGIYAWDGDFYAQALIERLGLFDTGGVLRLGLVHYTTAEEVDRTLDAVGRIAAGVGVPA
jgi:cysteine desulfurase family protein (TIGR01976 family)